MATTDLKSFIETRLRALDPSIDLESGSPAQVQLVEPLLSRLGTDPIETGVEAFILDRFQQEFPDIYASDPSVVRDLFIKPLILLLEPFKREIQAVRRSQSLQDPTLLSDDEAEALSANFFAERDTGGFAVGTARIYYSNPTNVQVEIITRVYTAGGLSYFPTAPMTITAEEMVFNRQGALFFIDIPVKAEQAGSEYNIEPETLIGVEGLFGAVRVTNPRRFSDGSSQLSTEAFVAQTRAALTERSLVTSRGATARINEVFQGDIRAIQVIGARDPEMQRDLLVATSPGHAWMTGVVNLYKNVALVNCRTIEGDTTDVPVSGDTLFVYLDKYTNSSAFAGIAQNQRLVRLTVEELIHGPMEASSPYQASYLVRWSGSFPSGVVLPDTIALNGGFSKKGTVAISSLAGAEVALTANNGEVHVFGHSDIYVRPTLQPVSTAVLEGIYDLTSFIERTTLRTTASSNAVEDTGIDFEASGVEVGDLLSIEVGDDAGNYAIGKVDVDTLYLTSNMSRTDTTDTIRYRIIKRLRVDPFDPRIPKFPFGSLSANDLQTTIGSNLFTLNTHDLLQFGAKVGDTIKVLGGSDEGLFTITGFDSVLGGKGVLVDRDAGASESGIQYELYTSLTPVEKPLVRIREILLLDSAKQSTGVTVPPAEAIGVVPTGDFTAARVRASSHRKSGIVLPDITGLVAGSNVAAPSGDRRYSLGFDDAEGIYKSVQFANGEFAEFSFRTDAQAPASYFLCTSEFLDESINYPPIDPKAGECLTIKSGPNAGSYLIDAVHKFKYKLAGGQLVWVYFVKIYGTFPVDPIKSILSFLDDAGVTTSLSSIPDPIPFPTFFQTFLADLPAKIEEGLTSLGLVAPTLDSIEAAVESLIQVDYEWGDPSRGVLRTYFREPTLFEQKTGNTTNPTLFNYETDSGENIQFRPDPNRYLKHMMVPARLTSDSDPKDFPRDLDASVAGTATFTDTTNPTVFSSGVAVGDILAVHQEIFLHGTKTNRSAVQTVAGTNQIIAPSTASGSIFTESMVGNLVFIEEGVDKGAYRVTKFVDGVTLQVDKTFTVTTPAILSEGVGNGWGKSGADNVVYKSGFNFTPYVNRYLTLYGIDSSWQGSYKINGVGSTNEYAVLQRTGDFPAFTSGAGVVPRFVITEAPTTAPTATTNGTELYGLRPLRMYEAVAEEFTVTGVTSNNPSISSLTFDNSTSLVDGVSQPYAIYRENIRRINPTEMDESRDGPFPYFDTEVISLSPQSAANISKDSYLTLAGSYESVGYKHVVDDPTMTYSMNESGYIDLPTRVLPVGVTDSPENFLSLVGAPVQISYERSELVRLLQDFLDSKQDRVTAANMLARHFLPAYVSFDAEYVGGSSASVVAEDMLAYINSIPVEDPLDVSKLEELIIRRGGNPVTPTTASILVHDWDRRAWVEFSSNQLGGIETNVPYNGTPRVSYFVPGPDVSGQETLPAGERISLVRR